MAFGDGNNDIEMFQAVGHSVAMGNASADLKAIASEVCVPVLRMVFTTTAKKMV